jgi:putative lipoprotein
MALPEGAVLRVLLLDIDAPDVPDWIVARSERPVEGQVPLDFSLGYDPHAIVEAVRYGVAAELLVEGEVWFATPEPVPVLTQGAPDRVDLVLRRAP